MTNYSILLSLLITVTLSDIPKCEDQAPCFGFTRESINDGRGSRICMALKNDAKCAKETPMMHDCSDYTTPKSKQICKEVKCGELVEFTVKDGAGCSNSTRIRKETISGINNIDCGYYGKYCSAEDDGDCVWSIPAEECKCM